MAIPISFVTVSWNVVNSPSIKAAEVRSRIVGTSAWTEQAANADPNAGSFTFEANAPNSDVEVQLRYRMVNGSVSPWVDMVTHTSTATVQYATVAGTPTSLSQVNVTESTKLGGIQAGADVTSQNVARDTIAINGVPAATIAGAATGATPSANRVYLSDFDAGTIGWTNTYNPDNIFTGFAFGSNGQGSYRYLNANYSATGSGQTVSVGTAFDFDNFYFFVTPGERLAAQVVVLATGPVNAGGFTLYYYDANNNQISNGSAAPAINYAVTNSLQLVNVFHVVPASAVKARIEVYFTTNGAGSGSMQISHPMISQATLGQTIVPTYVPGPMPRNGAAAVINANTTTINGGQITTGTVTANQISVANLASLTANLGVVTAGQIVSRDGSTNLNLDANTFNFSASSFNINAPGVASCPFAFQNGQLILNNVAINGGTINGGTINTVQLADHSITASLGIAQNGSLTGDGNGGTYTGYTGSSSTSTPSSSGSSSGGGGSYGGSCPETITPVLMADGSFKPAGEIEVGDLLLTRHETTMVWGVHRVIHARTFSATLWRANGLYSATEAHPFWIDGAWTLMSEIGAPSHKGFAVHLTIEDAHTFVTKTRNGKTVLNHNKALQN